VRVTRWLSGKDKALEWRSSGGSDAGMVRRLNEDAFLDMPQRLLWAVADGMGGHAAGDVASNEVVASLAGIPSTENLNAASGLVAGGILRANDILRTMAMERGSTVVIGATVVAAVARGRKLALLWAGDSRAYRLRYNKLEQLTRDHDIVSDMERNNASQELIDAVENSNVISRAVGAHNKLEIDEVRVNVEEGDVYLLCSDGLYRELDSLEITEILRENDPARAAARLIDGAVRAGGRDNVTVIVIHAGRRK